MNSKNKILGIGLIVMLGAMMLVITGCANKEAVNPNDNTALPNDTTNPEQPIKNKDIGKMNDELYVDIMAQIAYRVSRDDLYYDWVNGGYEKYLKDNGVTEEQLDAYVTLMGTNADWMAQMLAKIEQRVEKLSK